MLSQAGMAMSMFSGDSEGQTGASRLTVDSSDFLEELHKFNKCLDEVSRQVPLDFDPKNCQWSDVLRKLKDGNESLAKRMERDETWWSKGGMWLADLSSLSPALQAIPDDLCFLHGGLALALHLAKTRDSTKRNIVNTFEDVTSALARAGNAAEHSRDDPQLNNALDTLRFTLFKTLPDLIKILVPERLRKFSVVKIFSAERRCRLTPSNRFEICCSLPVYQGRATIRLPQD